MLVGLNNSGHKGALLFGATHILVTERFKLSVTRSNVSHPNLRQRALDCVRVQREQH
jgi:hypothetical protein